MSPAAIVAVKGIILQAMWVLIPAMVASGGSGFALAKGRSGRLLEAKKKCMPFIALNGLLILLPSAFYLHAKTQVGAFDTSFYAIQAVELVAGAINFWLLSKNMRDGLKLAGRLRPKKASVQVDIPALCRFTALAATSTAPADAALSSRYQRQSELFGPPPVGSYRQEDGVALWVMAAITSVSLARTLWATPFEWCTAANIVVNNSTNMGLPFSTPTKYRY